MTTRLFNSEILIRSLKKGEENAYRFLIRQYHQKLCIYAEELSRDKYLAEDIVQNVFYKVWKKRERLEEKGSLQSFLYKSVYNEFLDQYRKNKAVLTLEKKFIETLDQLIDEKEQNRLEILTERMKEEIQNLPPKCKEIFNLSKKEGLSNIEIAEYLGISKKTVEAHITKAFCLLRKRLKDEFMLFLVLLNLKLNKTSLLHSQGK